MRELLPWRVGCCFLWDYSSCSVLFLLVRSIDPPSSIWSCLLHYHLATFLRLFFYVSGAESKLINSFMLIGFSIVGRKSQRPHRAGLSKTGHSSLSTVLSPNRFERGLITIIVGFSSGFCCADFKFFLLSVLSYA